jgi:hypothetical protein
VSPNVVDRDIGGSPVGCKWEYYDIDNAGLFLHMRSNKPFKATCVDSGWYYHYCGIDNRNRFIEVKIHKNFDDSSFFVSELFDNSINKEVVWWVRNKTDVGYRYIFGRPEKKFLLFEMNNSRKIPVSFHLEIIPKAGYFSTVKELPEMIFKHDSRYKYDCLQWGTNKQLNNAEMHNWSMIDKVRKLPCKSDVILNDDFDNNNAATYYNAAIYIDMKTKAVDCQQHDSPKKRKYGDAAVNHTGGHDCQKDDGIVNISHDLNNDSNGLDATDVGDKIIVTGNDDDNNGLNASDVANKTTKESELNWGGN